MQTIDSKRRFYASAMAALVATTVVASGCGTRVRTEAGPSVGQLGSSAGLAPAAASGSGATSADIAAPDAGGTGGGVAPSAGGAVSPAAKTPSGVGSAAPSGKASVPAQSGGPSVAAPAAGGGNGPSGASPSPPAVPGATAPQSGARSPIVVGSIGTLSGPIGAVFVVQVQGAQTWVRYMNDRNGVNGHKIEYLIWDDGGDPARHFAQVREAVERKRVVAFLQNQEGITGASSVDYLNQKRVPVVGSEGGAPWFYTSPMHFPQKVHYEGLYAVGLFAAAQQMQVDQQTKLGTLTCVEIQTCAETDAWWTKHAPETGVTQVYRGRASVTQPDFSAECLSARNAGAEVLLVALDTSSVSRFALSCNRQGYHPRFATLGGIAADRMKDDPNLDGLIVASDVFPYFQSNTPATAEYQQAISTLGKGIGQGIGPATGWVSGKLFEKATRNLPEPPTSEAVLRGLWSIKNETLGGLSMTLSYTENQPTKLPNCWFGILIRNRQWVSTDGYRLNCR